MLSSISLRSLLRSERVVHRRERRVSNHALTVEQYFVSAVRAGSESAFPGSIERIRPDHHRIADDDCLGLTRLRMVLVQLVSRAKALWLLRFLELRTRDRGI